MKNKTLVYSGIGIALVVLAYIIWYLWLKSKVPPPAGEKPNPTAPPITGGGGGSGTQTPTQNLLPCSLEQMNEINGINPVSWYWPTYEVLEATKAERAAQWSSQPPDIWLYKGAAKCKAPIA